MQKANCVVKSWFEGGVMVVLLVIVSFLWFNVKASHVRITRQVGVGQPRGRDRVLRLEEAGGIDGYRAFINPDAFGQGCATPAGNMYSKLSVLSAQNVLECVCPVWKISSCAA